MWSAFWFSLEVTVKRLSQVSETLNFGLFNGLRLWQTMGTFEVRLKAVLHYIKQTYGGWGTESVGPCIWVLSRQRVELLHRTRRIRRCGLTGHIGWSVLLGVSFEVSEAHGRPNLSSLPAARSHHHFCLLPCSLPWWKWTKPGKL